MLRHIREALSYAAMFRGQLFVIKMSRKVSKRAEEFGVTADITLLSGIGIQVVLAHAKENLEAKDWPGLANLGRALPLPNTAAQVVGVLEGGGVPVLYYGDAEDSEGDDQLVDLAIKLRARKLIFLTDQAGVFDAESQLIRPCPLPLARQLLADPDSFIKGSMRSHVAAGVKACSHGIERTHILSGLREDALAVEVFTSVGDGTLIYSQAPYESIRPARPLDAQSIRDLLTTSGIAGVRTYGEARKLLPAFWVQAADSHIQGCVQIVEHHGANALEVGYIASVMVPHATENKEQLLQFALNFARERSLRIVFLREEHMDTMMRIMPWFSQYGFKVGRLRDVSKFFSASQEVKVWYKEVNTTQ